MGRIGKQLPTTGFLMISYNNFLHLSLNDTLNISETKTTKGTKWKSFRRALNLEKPGINIFIRWRIHDINLQLVYLIQKNI